MRERERERERERAIKSQFVLFLFRSENEINDTSYPYADFTTTPDPYQGKYSKALKVLKPFRPRSK